MNWSEACYVMCDTIANATAIAACETMCRDPESCHSGDQYFWGGFVGCFIGFAFAFLFWVAVHALAQVPRTETKFAPTYKLEGVTDTADCSEC